MPARVFPEISARVSAGVVALVVENVLSGAEPAAASPLAVSAEKQAE